jgi:hypothetical protein
MRLKRLVRDLLGSEFTDRNGVTCSIQESSAATEALLWLGCNEPNPQIFPGNGTGWHPYPLPENVQCTTRMHLTRRQVRALLPHLQAFAESGTIVPARRPSAPGGQ